MKGDFSKWGFNPSDNYRGVLHQQGRVLLDSDWNAQALISAHVDEIIGRDAFGPGVAAVPAALPDSLKVIQAKTDGTAVTLTLKPGRLWADGVPLYLGKGAPVDLQATYLPLPFNNPVPAVSSIAAGTRDAVVLEVWDEAVSGFQKPLELLETALGGPDTTERGQAAFALRLLRLSADEDCSTVAARLADDFGAKGKLTVTPAPATVVSGPCPVETGGGYTGFEHYLYRVEIGEPKAGEARFKWSQFNGGLVGRGKFDSGTNTVTIEANNQAINHCGLTGFYLEALRFNASLGHWEVFFAADATLPADDKLSLTPDWGTWPAATDTVFFRLWNGIEKIADFPATGTPKELKDGIRLQFQAATSGNANYAPGDFWTFPVRAAGVPFDLSTWPNNAPPQGVRYHRVPLAVVNWAAGGSAAWDKGEIDDCRRVFRPLTNQKLCCSFTVGDGKSSHGDFDSIEEALTHLPKRGGEICLLPGLHETNTVIEGRRNVRIKGCGRNSKVIPRRNAATEPIFRIVDSREIALENMEMASLEGTAIVLEGSKPGGVGPVEIAHNRILAFENAIRTSRAAGVNIHHNALRMLDKESAGVAIYLAADDSLIERNQIGVVAAASIPHFEPPGGKEVIHPDDRCARMETVYATPAYYYGYLNMVWAVAAAFQAGTIYQAQGGIQIAGSSERVKVLENAIHGGAGNGITLGSRIDLEELFGGGESGTARTIEVAGDTRGMVVDAAGKPVAAFQLSFTDAAGTTSQAITSANGTFRLTLAAGSYRVAEASPAWDIQSIEDVSDLDATGKLASNRTIYRITLGKAAEKPSAALDVFGFLYDIDIERNEISGMGRNGIGLPLIDLSGAALKQALKAATAYNSKLLVLLRIYALFGNPVMGLFIRNNLIANCLQAPFDAAMAAEAKLRGLGGVSLGICEELSVAENRIENNGLRHIDPVCGVYVAYGEGVGVTANRIVNNGPLAVVPAGTDLTMGRRGGIVLNLTAALTLLGKLTGTTGSVVSPRPAAQVHENTVDQPAGHSLYALAFGPVSATDNYLNNELSGNTALDRLAGSVLIWNIGGIQYSLGYAQAAANYTMMEKAKTAAPAEEAPKGMRISTNIKMVEQRNFSRAEAVQRIFPTGATLFNANQVRSGPGSGSFFSQLVASMDDVGYGENQCYSYNQGLISNCAVVGTTVQASNNRFREAAPETLLSLFSLSRLMNTTTFNQGDHCIVATNMGGPLHEVDMGNQVLLMTNLCTGLNLIADNLFKVKG